MEACGFGQLASDSHAKAVTGTPGFTPAAAAQRGSGPHPRQQRSHPHSAVFAPDNGWIYAADMGADEVLAFPFDVGTGHVGQKARAYRALPDQARGTCWPGPASCTSSTRTASPSSTSTRAAASTRLIR